MPHDIQHACDAFQDIQDSSDDDSRRMCVDPWMSVSRMGEDIVRQ